MVNVFRKNKKENTNLMGESGPMMQRVFGQRDLELFFKEVRNQGMIRKGTAEELGTYFGSFKGAIESMHSLVDEEVEKEVNLVRNGRDRTWIYDLKMHITEYEQLVEILEHANYSKYETCAINVGIIDEFFKKVDRNSGAIKLELRKDTVFGINLDNNFRELVEVTGSITECWDRNEERDRKFRSLVEKLRGRYVLMDELSAKIRRAKQAADEGDTEGIKKAKESVNKIASDRKRAGDSLKLVQGELERLFKPINGRVSEKYDYEFRFDKHSIGNFIRNNKEILEHFDIFVAKVRSLRGMLLAHKLDLNEKLEQGALAAAEKILKMCGDEDVSLKAKRGHGGEQAEDGVGGQIDLYGLIKKEEGLARYIDGKEKLIKGLDAAIERVREPMLAAAKQVEELVEEQDEIRRKIVSAQESVKKYASEEYGIEIAVKGDELVLALGLPAIRG
ncbi:MAG: hypothetical protein KGH54_01905 [Candidatus Micrarchaeota archaeon]|nr:hypothetical protein [Candidatus Micrarchaeota archaeon]